ncbi:MAG: ribosome-associated translation inhibitor RaiA [Pseudomonadota bacterium]
MRYSVSGQHLDIGNSLKGYVKDSFEPIVSKYAERPTDAAVKFSKDRYVYICESSIHLSTGHQVNASGKADDIYAAFDKCSDRIEKQLRRYKRRLKDHHNGVPTEVEPRFSGVYSHATENDLDSEPPQSETLIVAESNTKIKTLSVGDAVMEMELAAAPFLVFENEKSGRLSVVYHRDDGHIGWIDPTR